MNAASHQLDLKWGLAFEDLYRREGLEVLDARFIDHLKAADSALEERLVEARANPGSIRENRMRI